MTSLQSQYLLCPPLACKTARTHQQPKISTSGYFTWETGPWQQEKQHQMSQSPTNIGTDSQKPSSWKRLTRQTSLLWRSIETSASTCKGPIVQQSKGLGPAKLEACLVQRWIKIHAAEKRWPYTCLQMPKWEVRKVLRPWGRQFRRRKCNYVGCHILRPKHSTDTHPRQPYRRSIQRWSFDTKHAARMNLHREVFQRDNAWPQTARATVDFLANQNVTVLPFPFISPDLNPKEHLWGDLDRRVSSPQPAPQALQEL
jgi:hypothetical protein